MAVRARIEQMDQRIAFQSETTADDGQGGRTSSGWANIATVPEMWANVETRDGTETDQGERRPANVYQIDVIIRNRSDLTETMAIVWRSRRYNIRSIQPYNYRGEWLQIVAEGGVPL